MGYLVLARKWRPKGFDDLVGQEPIARVLMNAISQGKTSHAYLFSGPRGVGKTTTARILAKAMNCKEGPTPQPCGVCDSCTAVADASSVDVMEIDGASNNSVDDIRDLRERVKYAPSAGKYKVYIIDEAHMLSTSAFNALLKTLEEPPPHVIFVLATTEMKKIPATVLSRCQQMSFRKVPMGLIRSRLEKISEAEGIAIAPAALTILARTADGSVRDGLTILDQLSSYSLDLITEETVKDLLGIADLGQMMALARAVVHGDRMEILGIAAGLTELGTDLRAFSRDFIHFFRDLLVASVVRNPDDFLDYGAEQSLAIKEMASSLTEDLLTLMLSELVKAEYEVRASPFPRIAFEMSLIRISYLSTLRPIREIISDLDRYGKEGGSAAGPSTGRRQETPRPGPLPEDRRTGEHDAPASDRSGPAAPEQPGDSAGDLPAEEQEKPAGGEAEAPDTLSGIDAQWQRTLQKVGPLIASKIIHAPIELNGDVLTITLSGGQALFEESIVKSLLEIEKVLAAEAGRQITIRIATAQKKTVRKKDLKDAALKEPVIREALELFEGRIVDVVSSESSEIANRGGDNV